MQENLPTKWGLLKISWHHIIFLQTFVYICVIITPSTFLISHNSDRFTMTVHLWLSSHFPCTITTLSWHGTFLYNFQCTSNYTNFIHFTVNSYLSFHFTVNFLPQLSFHNKFSTTAIILSQFSPLSFHLNSNLSPQLSLHLQLVPLAFI